MLFHFNYVGKGSAIIKRRVDTLEKIHTIR